jgi:ATP-dependent Lon protease
VLKATRIVLVEHMDEVLREALCLPDPNQLFGPPRETMEYRDGELFVSSPALSAEVTTPAGSGPEPAPAPANA